MDAIGIFFKEPVSGKVKTRLASGGVSPEAATRLYTAFLKDTFNLVRIVDADFYCAAYAPPASPDFLQPLHEADFWVVEQRGTDFGQRMRHFFDDAFRQGASRAVLIGSDSPTLPPAILREALAALKTHPLVLGPAYDGGYYLIGLSQPCPEIFEGIPWSSSAVFSETVLKLKAAGKLDRLQVLPPWYDVDEPHDLELLKTHLGRLHLTPPEFFPLHTWEALKNQ